MQVDEPVPADRTNLGPSIMPKRPSTQSRVSIPEEAVQGACKQLERCIQPDDDDSIREGLGTVWIIVRDALSLEQTLRARLADRDEFQENVEKFGEKEFTELLRGITKKKNGGICLKTVNNAFLASDLKRPNRGLPPSPDVFFKKPEWSLRPATMKWCEMSLRPPHVSLIAPDRSFCTRVGYHFQRQSCRCICRHYRGLPRNTEKRLFNAYLLCKFVWDRKVAHGP